MLNLNLIDKGFHASQCLPLRLWAFHFSFVSFFFLVSCVTEVLARALFGSVRGVEAAAVVGHNGTGGRMSESRKGAEARSVFERGAKRKDGK